MSNSIHTNASSAILTLRKRAAHLLCALGIALTMLSAALFSPVHAAPRPVDMILSHVYVNYNGQVPSTSGNLVDVTYGMDEDGHIHDYYGNQMMLQANNTITDQYSQVVGFKYTASGP